MHPEPADFDAIAWDRSPWTDEDERAAEPEPDPSDTPPLESLLAAGLDLIPLRSRAKVPRDPRWLTRVYAPDELGEWVSAGGNVGIRLRLTDLVLDYDPRNDPAGDALTRFANAASLDLSRCPTTRTPAGGCHVFLRKPEGVPVVNSPEGFAGVEVKTRGRQVVAPGSTHPDHLSGPPYARDLARPDYSAAPDAPEALLALVRRPERKGKAAGASARISATHLALCLGKLDVSAYRDHEKWLELMTACHAATGGDLEAREAFAEWSTGDPPYTDHSDSIRARWDSFDASKPGGITLATLIHHLGGAANFPPAPAGEDFEPLPPDRPKLWGSGLTDTANAARFVLDHGEHVRFVEELNSWIAWDGRRWAPDLGLAAERLARETVRGLEREALAVEDTEKRSAALKFAIRSHQAGALAAIVRIARADVAVKAAELDAHPELLSTLTGVLDLRTSECSPPDPSLLITKLAPTEYRLGAHCPLWERFLSEVLPSASVRSAFQRFVGYALAGGQGAKAFAIVIGPPDSGKSTALGAIADTLGSDATEGGGAVTRAYVATATMDAFARHAGGNSPELARLAGARLVLVNEIPDGRTLESSAVKAWTGGDVVNATPKYGHPLSFRPDGKLCLVGNVMPGLDFTDDALWERVLVFPFEASVPEAKRDRGLRARFDRAGILAWAVEGHRAYREHGLDVPEVCRLARARRREEADELREFWLGFVEQEGGWLTTTALWHAYLSWCAAEQVPVPKRLPRRTFTARATARLGPRGVREGREGWRGWARVGGSGDFGGSDSEKSL